MKKLIHICSILSLAIIFSVVSVSAQSVTKFRAEVPNNFTFGQAAYASGNYEFRIAKYDSGGAAVSLLTLDGEFLQTVVAKQDGSAIDRNPELIFKRRNGGLFLAGIATRASSFALAAADSTK